MPDDAAKLIAQAVSLKDKALTPAQRAACEANTARNQAIQAMKSKAMKFGAKA